MPRARKTASGAPAQKLQMPADQAYGQGVDMMQMQRAMPAPQLAGQPIPAAPAPAGAVAPGSGAPGPAPDFAAMLQAAGGLRDQTGLLTAPTLRPEEPITAGLSRGPGPGPEALAAPTGSPAGNMMRLLTQRTGDPFFAELARKARA